MNWIAASYIALGFALAVLLLPQGRLRRAAHLLGAWTAALLLLIAAGLTLASAPVAHGAPLHLSILPALDFALDPLRAFFLGIAALVYAASIAFITFEAAYYSTGRARALLALTTVLYAAMVAIVLAARRC